MGEFLFGTIRANGTKVIFGNPSTLFFLIAVFCKTLQ